MAAPRELLRPFLFAAVAYLILAALLGLLLAALWLAGLPPPFGLRLAHVHLALLGSVSQAMLGAMPFFAMALLATLPPDPRIVRWQWSLANVGILALAAGFTAGWWPLALAGGLLFLVAVALVGWIIYRMMGRSLIGRRLDVHYYLAAALYGLLGMLLGLLLVMGVAGDWLPHAGLRLAHLHLTLVGWVSLTIVGTMYTFFPTIAGTSAGSAKVFRATFWLLFGGVAALAAGLLWLVPLGFLGGLAITAGALLLGYDVRRARRARAGPLGLAAKHLSAATLYFVLVAATGLFLLLWSAPGGPIDAHWLVAYAHLAVVGWMVQTLIGAMTHLLPVMAGGGRMGAGRPPTAVAEARYTDWRAVMEGRAPWQFWLLNGGLLLFVCALLVAPAFSLWAPLMLLGGLAMFAAFLIFSLKVARLYATLRGWAPG